MSGQTIYLQVFLLPSVGSDQGTLLQGNGQVKWEWRASAWDLGLPISIVNAQ